MKDYYRILGVLDDAEDIIIKAAYRALAQRYHPDKWSGDQAEATKRMTDINEAYSELSDALKRKKYDEEFFKFKSRNEESEEPSETFDEQSNTVKKLSIIDRILKEQKTNFKIIYNYIKIGIVWYFIIMSIIITILFSNSYLNKNNSDTKNTVELIQKNFTFLNCLKCIDGICNNETTSFEIQVVPSNKVIIVKNNLIKSSLMEEVNSKEDCTFNKNTYEFYCRIINENKQFNELTEIKFDGYNLIEKSQTLFNERTRKVSNIDLTCIGNKK